MMAFLAFTVVQGLVFGDMGLFLVLRACPGFPHVSPAATMTGRKKCAKETSQKHTLMQPGVGAQRAGKRRLTHSPAVRQAGRQAAREAQHPVYCSRSQAAGLLKMKVLIYVNRLCLVLIKLLHVQDPLEMLQCVVIIVSSKMA